MRYAGLVLKEALFRWPSTLLTVGIIAVVSGSVLFFHALEVSSTNELERIMSQVGKDIVILPKGATLKDYWSGDMPASLLVPQSYVGIIAKCGVPIRHVQGLLQRKITLSGKQFILCGMAPEFDPPSAARGISPPSLEPAEAMLGSRAAKMLELKEGNLLPLPSFGKKKPAAGPPFLARNPLAARKKKKGGVVVKVTGIRPETGTPLDTRIYLNIDTARRLLDIKESLINVIEATSPQGRTLRAEEKERLRKALSEEKVPVEIHYLQKIDTGREKALASRKKTLKFVSIASLIFGILAVTGFVGMNIQEREKELGILLATAMRPVHVVKTLVMKMVSIAVVGGLVGTAFGRLLVDTVGKGRYADAFPPFSTAAWVSVLLALLVVAVPTAVGMVRVVRIDPAETLREL